MLGLCAVLSAGADAVREIWELLHDTYFTYFFPLARSLKDPTVELAYWLPDRQAYVDPDGRPIDLPAEDSGRVVSVIGGNGDGEPLAALLSRLPVHERVACGSSLKFCRVAEGGADLYPRLAPTFEWDVAAGNAVLAGAGGLVTRPDGTPLVYGQVADEFRVPAFLAFGDPAAVPRIIPPARC